MADTICRRQVRSVRYYLSPSALLCQQLSARQQPPPVSYPRCARRQPPPVSNLPRQLSATPSAPFCQQPSARQQPPPVSCTPLHASATPTPTRQQPPPISYLPSARQQPSPVRYPCPSATRLRIPYRDLEWLLPTVRFYLSIYLSLPAPASARVGPSARQQPPPVRYPLWWGWGLPLFSLSIYLSILYLCVYPV